MKLKLLILTASLLIVAAHAEPQNLVSGSLSGAWVPGGTGNVIFLGNEMRLDNASQSGQTYASLALTGRGINPILDSNPGLLQWSFNMRNLCADGPSDQNRFGIVLAATGHDPTTASGLAVLVGNNNPAGTPTDFPRLIHFQNGISNSDRWLEIASGGPDTQKPTDFLSVRVTYDPATDLWTLYGSKTHGSYSNPLLEQSFIGSGTFGAAGSFPYLGVWSLHTTGNTQDRSFAYLGADLIPEPRTLVLILSGLFLLMSQRKRGRP